MSGNGHSGKLAEEDFEKKANKRGSNPQPHEKRGENKNAVGRRKPGEKTRGDDLASNCIVRAICEKKQIKKKEKKNCYSRSSLSLSVFHTAETKQECLV